MHKLISLALSLCLLLSLAACGGSGNPNSSASVDASGESTATTGQDIGADTTVSVGTETTEDGQEGTTQGGSDATTPTADFDTQDSTQPSAGTILETTPGNEQSKDCKHIYKETNTKASTCTVAGTKTFTCSKCESSYTEALALAAHKYAPATCTTAQTCSGCGAANGGALGHDFGSNGTCSRCGEKEGPITFTATVRAEKNKPVANITVSVYTDASATRPAGTGVTNKDGVATIELEGRSTSYRVVLSDVASLYEYKDSYTFSSTRVNINITTLPVLDPLDHSNAQYKVGGKMEDFTLTDTDGNTYNLSTLLQENELVVLDFWYVNCNPCKKEFPYFEAALEKYGDDITLLALNPIDSEASIRQLRNELACSEDTKVTFPMIAENLGMDKGFDVTAYPVTVIIDSLGTIVSIHRNAYDSETEFIKELESFL